MRVETRIAGVRSFVHAARLEGKSIGLVPTMGAFHEGHLSLMRRSAADNDVTVVSLFVNPTQFGPDEDLATYPRDLERDARMARDAGVSLIFAPTPEEMYPAGTCTWVTVEGLTSGLCGPRRPGHFRGVTTVVCKLLNIVQPDRAYFGEKDFQQLQVIRQMAQDLSMPVTIVGQPIVRESDGLALSSRNAYLSPPERTAATLIHRALEEAGTMVRSGASGDDAVQHVRRVLESEPLLQPEYVEAVDPRTLQPAPGVGRPILLAAAVRAGKTRLIDNTLVEA